MTEQLPLFPDERSAARLARARTADPSTSHEAAKEVTPRIGSNQQMVLKVVEVMFGDRPFTDVELVAAYDELWEQNRGLGLMLQTQSGIRTRRHELTEAGFFVKAGETRIGKRKHSLWRRVNG